MKDILVKYIDKIDFDKTFRIYFHNGEEYQYGTGEPVFSIKFNTPGALEDLLVRGSLGFGEALMYGSVEVEGDYQDVVHLGFRLQDDAEMNPSFLEKLKILIGFLSRRNTLEGSRKNISAHYDLGNDFYELWLDEELQYTCAYFHDFNDTLEMAQKQKMDLVCRKLRLQPGETIVEAGCGWGHLAIHAVENYGVKVKAFNISKEQIAHAREMAEKRGLTTDQVEFIQDDYRIIENESFQYDKFVSIGMLEHVGRENYQKLFEIIHKVVKPNGLAMVHTIGKSRPSPINPWMEKHIFPGGYIPSLSEIVTPLEKIEGHLHVVDVHNLRYHYALTLDHWSERFEKHKDLIIEKYDDVFYRKFLLYLRASAAAFRYDGVVLFQVLLSNGYDDAAPLTRHHFYTHSPVKKAASKKSAARKGSSKKTAGKKSSKKKSAKKKGR